MATPTSTRRIGVMPFRDMASVYTSAIDSSEPRNAPVEMDSLPPRGRYTPTSMARTAPKEAPEDMPST